MIYGIFLLLNIRK